MLFDDEIKLKPKKEIKTIEENKFNYGNAAVFMTTKL
jgi:hypothetical protein